MSDVSDSKSWVDNKTLVISWLLVFVPVGLYGLWKGSVFPKNYKIGITVAIIIAFIIVGGRMVNGIHVFMLYPIALYLLWKSSEVSKKVFYRFAAGWGVLALLSLVNGAMGSGGGYPSGGSCSAVMTKGNCTYYRDDNCNVIARQCE